MKKMKLWLCGLLLGALASTVTRGADVYATTIWMTNAIIVATPKVVIGTTATYGTSPCVVIGDCATGTYWAVSMGNGANGDNVGTAVGVWCLATNWGVSVGYRANGSSYGVALGSMAQAVGLGNIAIGGAQTSSNYALVPTNFLDSVELGRGTAVLNGGLNFRGYGIVNSNGVIVAPFSASNLVVSGGLTLTNGSLNLSGSTVSGLSASQITNGQFSASVMPIGTTTAWNANGLVVSNLILIGGSGGGAQTLQQVLTTGNNANQMTITNVVLAGVTIYGNGVGLTNLNASMITTGTLAATFLPATGGWNAGNLTATNLTIVGGTVSNLTVTGSLTGNGSGLTNIPSTALTGLNAGQLTNGILSTAVLPTNGVWNAGTLTVTNLNLAGVSLGTNYLTTAGGTVTNLTILGQATVPAMGDLVMGSYTNKP